MPLYLILAKVGKYINYEKTETIKDEIISFPRSREKQNKEL